MFIDNVYIIKQLPTYNFYIFYHYNCYDSIIFHMVTTDNIYYNYYYHTMFIF